MSEHKANEKQFIEAWRIADLELKRLKKEKLCSLPDQYGATQIGASVSLNAEAFHSHGLARWQAWMTRLRVLTLSGKRPLHE